MAAKDRERLHAEVLEWLAVNRRADLWGRLAFESELPATAVWDWALERWAEQAPVGERLTLRLPTRLRPPKGDPAEWLTRAIGHGPAFGHKPYYTGGRAAWIEAFAGVYLEDDLTSWPAPGRWPGLFRASKIQPLALVALAASEVQAATGCTPEEAAMFLLSDVRFPAPALRVSMRFPGGMHLWSPDSMVTAEDLARQYAAARQAAGLGRRAKGVEEHTAELIELVSGMRPRRGRSVLNESWHEVLARWNAEHPGHEFANAESISRAHKQAVNRRRKKGLL